ncbi:MAG: phosphoenolpyruvate--protein phosphotransferase [Caldiserica bacterium]|nr:phosphoenolpyruvate--protein phosphotransferase [Caldisericota bacterium]
MKLKGIPVSPGVAIGDAFVLKSEVVSVPAYRISESKVPQEVKKFFDAILSTKRELRKIQERVAEDLGGTYPEIFSAHLLFLDDPILVEGTVELIEKERWNAEKSFDIVVKKVLHSFSSIPDEYLRGRALDLKDVARRVLKNLLGKGEESLSDLKKKAIVISYDLSPSQTASLDRDRVLAFATDVGGRSSHTAIMARALAIPAVVGLGDISKKVKSGDLIIVDGNKGVVFVNPASETLKSYTRKKRRMVYLQKVLSHLKDLPAETLDGHRVKLMANIELPKEVENLASYGGEGVGLFRTEFLFLNREVLPSEDEQFEVYHYVASKVYPEPVVIRTLDLGGDKFASPLEIPKEINPFMGWRAIRFCLARKDIFLAQLKAILRAGKQGNVKLMYPMISSINELRQANHFLQEAKEILQKEGKDFSQDIEVGVMIETPSAAIISDFLAGEVAFFSVGTNDLIQYAMAADRGNEKIAHLYQPAHPAILRLLKHIIDTGHSIGIPVAMCGEMAGDIHYTQLLLGMGLDQLSMGPVAIPQVKQVIRSVTYKETKALVEKVLKCSTQEEVKKILEKANQPFLKFFRRDGK